jgi:drug/metabolite transporter (DMT)-like permease
MSTIVLVAVLASALLHVAWNTMVKTATDGSLATALIALGGGVVCALALPFLPPIQGDAWLFVAGSVVAQSIYYPLVAATYRAGDMSQTYPLMRGTAPLLVAVASGPVVHERLEPGQWLGVALICAGVWAIGIAGTGPPPGGKTRRRLRLDRSTALALLTACVIAVYTLIDGHGSRISGAPVTYTAWIFLVTAIPMVAIAAVRRPAALRAGLRTQWWLGLMGGSATVGAYGLALWAMTRAPIATVAALRETSIIFATLIGAIALKETLPRARIVGTGVIVAGVIALRLS